MPPIPRAQRTQTIPGGTTNVPVSIEVAGATGRAVSQLGATATNIIAKNAERMRQQDNVNRAMTIRAAYDDDHRAFKGIEKQKTGIDTYDNQAEGKKFRKEMQRKYSADITDLDLKANIDNYILGRSGNLLDELAGHQATQRNEVTKQSRDMTLQGLLKDSYDEEVLESTIGRWSKSILAQKESGAYGEEQAIDLIRSGEEKIAEAQIDGLINTNPGLAVQAIEAGTYDQYLSQEKQKEFDKKAKTMTNALNKDAKARLKEEEKRAKDALRQSQNETGNQFLQSVMVGELTETDVLKSNLNPTGGNSKEHWLAEIKKRNNKDIEEEWKTDPQVEADFLTRITADPQAVSDSEITAAQGNGLDTTTAKELVNFKASRINKQDDPQKSEEAKTAVKRLNDAKVGKYFNGNKQENAKQWADATVKLKRFIKNNPEGDPNMFVDQILEPKKDGFVRSIVDSALGFFGAPDVVEFESAENRAARLTEEAGPSEPEVPNIDTWLKSAKKVNKGVPDSELINFYNNKYGVK